jgi:hypothetical protein
MLAAEQRSLKIVPEQGASVRDLSWSGEQGAHGVSFARTAMLFELTPETTVSPGST